MVKVTAWHEKTLRPSLWEGEAVDSMRKTQAQKNAHSGQDSSTARDLSQKTHIYSRKVRVSYVSHDMTVEMTDNHIKVETAEVWNDVNAYDADIHAY